MLVYGLALWGGGALTSTEGSRDVGQPDLMKTYKMVRAAQAGAPKPVHRPCPVAVGAAALTFRRTRNERIFCVKGQRGLSCFCLEMVCAQL